MNTKLPISIEDLLYQRTIESERIEYKADGNSESILHTIFAFVNDFHNFPDGAGGDSFEEKIFTGPLGRITQDSLDYIKSRFLKETVIKHPDRAQAERFWNYPFIAIEEAVVNAVYHRSYEERNPIEIRIYPDEIIILSYPGADRSIRLDDLQAGRAVTRRYRNRRIGEFLKELDLTEGRSTGVPKILRAMKKNGSPMPTFETDDERTYFLVKLPIHQKAMLDESVIEQNTFTPQATPQAIKLLTSLNNYDNQVITRQEWMDLLGLKDSRNFRKVYLNPALTAGLIEMTIPDKPNSPNQQYRLTTLGKAVVK